MSAKHDINGSIFRRLARKCITAAAATGLLCAATPAHADSAASIAGDVACDVMNAYVPGSGTLLSSLTGGTSTVDLSSDAFAQIKSIVEDVVTTYAWNDYSANFTAMVGYADIYVRLSGNDDDRRVSLDDAGDIVYYAGLSMAQMDVVGLQGTPSYMIASSIYLRFLEEMAEIEDELGETSAAASHRAARISKAAEHLTYLKQVWADWDAAAEEAYPIVSSGGQYCLQMAGFPFFCQDTITRASSKRDELMGGGRDDVLGTNFVGYMRELAAITGESLEKITWYQDVKYGGTSYSYDYTGSNGKCVNMSSVAVNDWASSVRFIGRESYTTTLAWYKDANCSGSVAGAAEDDAASGSAYNLKNLGWNDTISSFRVMWNSEKEISNNVCYTTGTTIMETELAKLIFQTDGNLVLYKRFPGSSKTWAAWASGTNGQSASKVCFQSDGNLVVYKSTGAALWDSDTNGSGATQLKLQADCNLVAYDANGNAKWETDTNPCYDGG